jgi:N-acetylmuramoyl-L-alanine amidase
MKSHQHYQATALALMATLLLSSCATAQTNFNSSSNNNFATRAPGNKRSSARVWIKPTISEAQPLLIVYPPCDNSNSAAPIAAATSFFVGATYPGFSLTVNGQAAQVNKQGFFAHVISLAPGKNQFKLTVLDTGNKEVFSRNVEISREKARSFISGNLRFDGTSLEPKEDRGLAPGDIVEFAARATPESNCFVMLGSKKVNLTAFNTLKSKSGKTALNRGLEAAYGQVFQRYARTNPDLYIGLYRVEPTDSFNQEQPVFYVQKAGQTISQRGKGKITVVKQPVVAHTLHNDTITRATPDQARLTPLPEGVRLLVDGYQGENIRCLYSPRKHVWIKREDLQFEQGGATPTATARTIMVQKDEYGETLVVPLSQRLPFSIDQELKPNKLVVRLFGVQADTDWAAQAPADMGGSKLLEDVGFKQSEDGVYELQIELKGNRQWGYFADYDDNSFTLHIKRPPKLSYLNGAQAAGQTSADSATTAAKKLDGLTICLDPGHGGSENGAIGCSAEREADLNLAIALKFRDLLQADGATVIMTREGDQEVSLSDRVALANDRKVDMLISIHNNALPDGRDPVKEHGTSSYWYHKQSKELARALKNGLVKETGLPDTGDRFQNLALCRPSAMQAVLMEAGYVVNPDEYAKLIDPAFQEKAARGLLSGLYTYLGVTK